MKDCTFWNFLDYQNFDSKIELKDFFIEWLFRIERKENDEVLLNQISITKSVLFDWQLVERSRISS